MCTHGFLKFCAFLAAIAAVFSIGLEARIAVASGPTGKSGTGGESATALNLFEKHKEEYVTSDAPTIVNVAPATYLTISGRGAPEGGEFQQKVGVIYGVAYGVKMKSKFTGKDFAVSPLEGLWWGNKDKHDFLNEPRETWNWKLLIRMPKFITDQDIAAAAKQVARPDSGISPADIKLETLSEGKCVQVLHVGPYSAENVTIATMRAFAKKKGLTENGVHHEIYLSDPNKTPPEELRTILRQPVK